MGNDNGVLPVHIRKRYRKELNAKNYPSEKWFEGLCLKKGVRGYRRNQCVAGKYFGDFVFRKIKIIVEIDGSSHNGKEEYDKQRDDYIRQNTPYVIHRIKAGDEFTANLVIKKIRDFQSELKTAKKKFKEVVYKKDVVNGKCSLPKKLRRQKRAEFCRFVREAVNNDLSGEWLKKNGTK